MEERHIPLSTVAGRLGVSERTVRRWIKAGKLRAYRPGRDFRIPESAVKQLVEESEISPKVQAPPENSAQERREPEVHTSGAELEGEGTLLAEGRIIRIADEDMRAIVRSAVRGELDEEAAMREVEKAEIR